MPDAAHKKVSHSWLGIVLPAILTSLLFTGTIFFLFLPELEGEHMARKKEMLSEVTETAWSILHSFEAMEKQHLITREEAQHQAMEQIRGLRYGANRLDYFWLTDMQHRMVMHPYRPDFEGMDMTLTDDADEKGTPLSVEFVRLIRESGEGFVRYNWQWQNDPGRISAKLSFVKGFAPWDWYIGTGVYIDEVMAEIAAAKRRIFAVTGGILLLVFLLTFYIVRQAMLGEKSRRETETALLISEKRYKELANSLPQFVFETDRMGKFTFVNGFFMETLKYSREDIDRGMQSVDILAPEDRERGLRNIASIFRGEEPGNAEYTIQTRDGRKFPALVHSRAIMINGVPVGIRGVAIDITEQKEAREEREQLERQMRQASKMQTIGTLAGGIAHDFNNILAAILGYADLMKDSLAPNDPNTYSIEQILRASYRAKGLVKQILVFSRQGAQEKQPLQLDLMIKEACHFLRASLPATIAIDLKITAPPKRLILADATQIHQLILSVCTNSAHAMAAEGGEIRILLSEEIPSGEVLSKHPDVASGIFLKMEIRDTGPGIPPDTIHRIFDPFFTTKERGEGTGLGLALVHGIVQSHGGFIKAASTVGKGTTITVYLPVHQDAADIRAEELAPPPGGGERILFVDDEEMLVTMSEKLFKKLGYDIVTTTREHEALEILRREPDGFDLLITDLIMPNMTGLDLAKEARKIKPGLPVILCTGFADQIDPETMEKTGIAGIIYKPPLKQDIANMVRKVLDRK
jgi:PAS domain S-box-containing protein